LPGKETLLGNKKANKHYNQTYWQVAPLAPHAQGAQLQTRFIISVFDVLKK
jgi:hypothetical protein